MPACHGINNHSRILLCQRPPLHVLMPCSDKVLHALREIYPNSKVNPDSLPMIILDQYQQLPNQLLREVFFLPHFIPFQATKTFNCHLFWYPDSVMFCNIPWLQVQSLHTVMELHPSCVSATPTKSRPTFVYLQVRSFCAASRQFVLDSLPTKQ